MLCYKERTIYLHPLLSTSIKQLPTLLKIAQCANKRHLPIEFPEVTSKSMFNVQQVCIPVGCVPPACCPYLPACTAQGWCLLQGGLHHGGAAPGGSLPLREPASGGSACSWGGVSQHALRQTPPVDRMTDRCKNITFANFVCGR